jgi:hypothetical protein
VRPVIALVMMLFSVNVMPDVCLAATGTAPAELDHPSAFKNGASSTGWINFNFANGKSILIPATVNGRAVLVKLIDGADMSYIDKDFAASLGTQSAPGHKDTLDVRVQLGDFTLLNVKASAVRLGAVHSDPLFTPFILSDDVFDHAIVDIDFEHHRIAFLDPGASITLPHGAVEMPFVHRLGLRTLPVSVEGAAPVPFEWFLGDPAPVTVYEPYYDSHHLLQNRTTSIRLGGGLAGQRPQETVATLNHVEFAGIRFSGVPGVFPSNAVRGSDSALISGNIGLALLARFRLIIDYPHDRMYAVPYSENMGTAFARDRLGLYLSKQDAQCIVDFVAPGSPAQATGFTSGNRFAMIDQKSCSAWTSTELANVGFVPKGHTVKFTTTSGETRQITADDYF